MLIFLNIHRIVGIVNRRIRQDVLTFQDRILKLIGIIQFFAHRLNRIIVIGIIISKANTEISNHKLFMCFCKGVLKTESSISADCKIKSSALD